MSKHHLTLATVTLLSLGAAVLGGRLALGAARPAIAVLQPIAAWSFEDGSLCDQHGRRCAAPLGGAVADGAAILSSPGDALRVPDRSAPRLRGKLSVAAWVSASAGVQPIGASAAAARHIVTQGGAGGYDLAVEGDRYRFTIQTGPAGAAPLTVSAVAPPGGWVHVAGVFDGAAARLYLNGRLAAATEAPAGAERLTSGGPLLIGAQPAWAAAPWLIDDVRLYAGALGPVQVAHLAGGTDGCVAGRRRASLPEAPRC